MPLGGFHLSRNVYICSKGNALVCYSPPKDLLLAHPFLCYPLA